MSAVNAIKAQLAKCGVRIRISHHGEERESTHYVPCITIGRANGASSPDLDLNPDTNVSRNHARLWIEEKVCWIEDLGSKFGTRVDGQPIAGKGRVRVDATRRVEIGDTIVTVEPLGTGLGGFTELPAQPAMPSTIEIGKTLQSSPGSWVTSQPASLDAAQRQGMLLEILLQFSLPSRLDQLMQTITTRVVELIPGAKRGTLLLRNASTDKLVLAAFVATGSPAVSETLARRALERKEAFVWRNSFGFDPAASIQRHQIQSGMYAPLIYDGEALGVLCVDNPNTHTAFSEDDLQLLVVVADHAAVSVHHQQLEEELSSRAKTVESLLWNFSPKTKALLVDKARSGQLCTNLERSEVAIMAVSFRNLEAKLSTMSASERSQVLAAYTDAVANSVFQYDGTLFTDPSGIFVAVFGAPEKQADPNGNAARAAQAIRAALAEVNNARVAASEPACAFSIAVNCGELLHGFTGSTERLQFHLIGQAVQHTIAQSETGFAELAGIELKAA